jgi:hypothetical protein
VHLEAAGAEQCRIDQILTVGHPYHQDVVKRVDAVEQRE